MRTQAHNFCSTCSMPVPRHRVDLHIHVSHDDLGTRTGHGGAPAGSTEGAQSPWPALYNTLRIAARLAWPPASKSGVSGLCGTGFADNLD